MNVMALFASLLTGQARRRGPKSRRLLLERLGDRICPAKATWNAAAAANWQDFNNWKWTGDDAADFKGLYPGEKAGRVDVVFDATSKQDCKLDVDLAATLNSLTINNTYNKLITLNGNVKVGGKGFNDSGGTVDIVG